MQSVYSVNVKLAVTSKICDSYFEQLDQVYQQRKREIAKMSDMVLEASPPDNDGPESTFLRLYEVSAGCAGDTNLGRDVCNLLVFP